jgi:hypothetical protein
MGTLDDGGSGPFDDLPELPPGWGPIRIPDDASELADEAARVRRELRERGDRPRAARPAERGAAAGAPRPGAGGHVTELRWHPAEPATEPPSLRLPLLIVTAALLAAVASLFAVAWSGARRPAVQESAQTTETSAVRTVPALELIDEAGAQVPLRALLPAAIVLTDVCACESQVGVVRGAAPPGVTVIDLSRQQPSPAATAPAQPAPAVVRRLRDPGGELRRFLGTAPTPGRAPLLLVDRTGEVVGQYDATEESTAYAAELATLATT